MKESKLPDKWYHILFILITYSYYRFFCGCDLCAHPGKIVSIMQHTMDVLLVFLICCKAEYSFLVFEGVDLYYIDEYNKKHETVFEK